MKEILTKIIQGDSRKVLETFDENLVNLIFTSPPYADRRIQTYGGMKPENYVKR